MTESESRSPVRDRSASLKSQTALSPLPTKSPPLREPPASATSRHPKSVISARHPRTSQPQDPSPLKKPREPSATISPQPQVRDPRLPRNLPLLTRFCYPFRDPRSLHASSCPCLVVLPVSPPLHATPSLTCFPFASYVSYTFPSASQPAHFPQRVTPLYLVVSLRPHRDRELSIRTPVVAYCKNNK